MPLPMTAATTTTTVSLAKECLTVAVASYGGGWKSMASAPRDGTVIETLETYGVAPWYGIFKWTKERAINNEKGEVVHYQSNPTWIDAEDSGMSVAENECLFWRPYHGTDKYVDPTGGAQKTVAYECAWMHLPYDAKTGHCKAR